MVEHQITGNQKGESEFRIIRWNLEIQWNCFVRLCIFAYLWASSSRVYTSGYCVFSKYLSSISSCSAVNVVLARLCFLFNVNPGSDSQSESSELDPPKIVQYRIQDLNFTKQKPHTVYTYMNLYIISYVSSLRHWKRNVRCQIIALVMFDNWFTLHEKGMYLHHVVILHGHMNKNRLA